MTTMRRTDPATPVHHPSRLGRRGRSLAMAAVAAVALAACGGGSDTTRNVDPASCTLDAQKQALRTELQSNYLWYRLLQNPDPAASNDLGAWLGALVSPGDPGNLAAFPKDRWSGLQATEVVDRFYGDGETLGYGFSVAGLEVRTTTLPLRVRHVEPLSPAATAGVQRGDIVVQVNGRPASELTQADDFGWLTASEVGTALNLVLRSEAGQDRTVQLRSAVFKLTPLSTATVLTSPAGRKVGYLVLKDFIAQANSPLVDAFAQFSSAGVQDLVVDLRYNGGGLVSVAVDLASRIAQQAQGRPFAVLRHNDKRSGGTDVTYPYSFLPAGQALRLSRVYVITGSRTCSASELLINGLKPFADVVQIGGTTCGKPVGFLPWDNRCGSTVMAVNFESVNALGQGRYWDGIEPAGKCAIADDFRRALGDPAEVLTAAALTHVDTGACPAATASGTDRLGALAARLREARRLGITEPGEHTGMIDR